MESKFNYLVVGIFVVIFSILIMVWCIWLAGTGHHAKHKTYLVYMKESVAGLNNNAPVKFNGVDVGYVNNIQLKKDDPEIVKIEVKIFDYIPINNGTTATMMTQGLTGIGYLGLKTTSDSLESLATPPGEKYPVIRSAPSLFFRLDIALRQVIESLQSITTSVSNVLSPQNVDAVTNILHNINTFTGTLSSHDPQISQSLDQMAVILNNSALASEQMPDLIHQMSQTTQSFEELSQELKSNPSIIIRGQLPAPPGPGE